MRDRKANAGGAHYPLRYWPIVLIAAAIAESVHAPLIHRSAASSAMPEANAPSAADTSSPPAKELKKPVTVNPNPSSDDPEFTSDPTDAELQPFVFPMLQDASPNLLPDVPAENLSAGLDPAFPSVGADPLIQLPPWSQQGENGFGGVVAPNGIISQSPVNPGRATVQTSPITTAVTPVPEPGSGMILAMGALGLLRRRCRCSA
jgi:hypothetical protein